MMEELKVGGYYKKDIMKYPCQEGIKFHFDNSGGLVQIFYNRPTQKELDNIRKGKMKIGLLEKNGIIFVLVKFGELDWMDMPYSPHLAPDFEFQEVEDGKGYGITIILVESTNGEIQCLRYIGAPTKWSRDFKKMTTIHKMSPFKREFYDETLQDIYRNYPTDTLVKYSDIYKV